MRAGPDTLLAQVVKAFGEAQAHHAYLFTNKRCNRMKILVSDSFGLWMLVRRLHEGRFHRKFYEIYEAKKSDLAKDALEYIKTLYRIETECKTLSEKERQQIRQTQSKPVIDEFYKWIIEQRLKVPKGSPISKAIHYTLKRWDALNRYRDDGAIPIDNNWIENQIRPWALGRKNWLFAGSLRGGQRAAAVMSLIQSAKLNGHDPYVYLKDVFERLPTEKASAIDELLPHNWSPLVNG